MRLSIVRAIPLALALAVAGLLISGISRFKDAHHGVDYVVGEAAWLVFVAGALTTIVLAAVALTRRARRAEAS
jgi:uncharacterized membrane protein SirB2